MSDVDFTSVRTLLFVPGDRPDRFEKAATSGADGIVLDLEDAIAAAGKDEARQRVDAWLADGGVAAVRINASDTPWFERDLAMVSARRCTVMLPKANGPSDVQAAVGTLPHARVIPLIETAAGVLNAAAICSATGVIRVAFGSLNRASRGSGAQTPNPGESPESAALAPSVPCTTTSGCTGPSRASR